MRILEREAALENCSVRSEELGREVGIGVGIGFGLSFAGSFELILRIYLRDLRADKL